MEAAEGHPAIVVEPAEGCLHHGGLGGGKPSKKRIKRDNINGNTYMVAARKRRRHVCGGERSEVTFICLLSLLCPFSLCFSLFCVRCQGPLPQWDLRGLGPWRQSARSRGSGGLEAPQGMLILQAMGLRGGCVGGPPEKKYLFSGVFFLYENIIILYKKYHIFI